MSALKTTYFLFLLSYLCSHCYGARILGLFPFQGKSHFNMFEILSIELANKGHHIDVLSHFPQKHPIPRYTDINVKGSLPEATNNVTFDLIKDVPVTALILSLFSEAATDICEAMFQHPEVHKLKHTTVKYDLIITEVFGTECMLGFAHLFKTPVVAITTSVMLPWANQFFGNIDNPSYIPSYFLPYQNKMNFIERTLNTALTIFSDVSYYLFSTIPCTKLAREFFGTDLPMLDVLARNISLLLVNSHYSINQARPFSPNVIEVGGMHIKPSKQLDSVLNAYMNSSQKGVIYFSLGSMIQAETFPEDKIKALIESFKSLPYNIIWKADKTKITVPIPPNIKIEKWFPQKDILCHPKTQLFITHGGTMGTQEAIYCGIPLLGIPFFGDQYLNIQNYEVQNLAVSVSYNDITTEYFTMLLKQVLENSSYKDNAIRMKSLFTDRPVKPLELAVWSVEHVLKNNGAVHLKPESVNLWWFQYLLLDVITFFIVCVLFLFMILKFTLKLIVLILNKVFKKNKVKMN